MNLKSLKRKILIVVSLFMLIQQGFIVSAFAGIVKGRVVNAFDNQPLPFVQITYSSHKQGTASNIDGWFSVPDTIAFLNLTYSGYQPITVLRKELYDGELVVRMVPSESEFSSPEGSIQKNTGLLLMKKVVEHRGQNDPEKYNSYQYTSFQKFSFSPILLSEKLQVNDNLSPDTLKSSAQKPKKGISLFSMETLSRKKMLQPDHRSEEIISASFTGEAKKPYLSLASQLQDLSVYDEFFTVLDRSYLSPVSKVALKNYYYALTDTFLSGKTDTVFVIRFDPVKSKSKNRLKGILHISSNGYAVQALSADRAVNDVNASSFSIQQQYDLSADGKWFPGEQNTSIRFAMKMPVKKGSIHESKYGLENNFIAVNRTSSYQREINLPLKPTDFSKYEVAINPGLKESAGKGKESFRDNTSGKKDSLNSSVSDSIRDADYQAGKLKLIRLLAEGKIPVGYVNINYDHLFSYNLYEGVKVGIGAESNRRLSKYFTFGGYVSYGFKDKSVRQGEWFDIYPKGYYDFRLHLGFRDMNMEFGEAEFLEKKTLLSPEFYRNLLIENMYSTKRYSAGVELRPFQELNSYLFGDLSDNSARTNNFFLQQHTFTPFRLVRMGLQLRYSPGITFIRDPDMLIENTAPKSDWFFTVIQGLNTFGGEYRFTKMEFRGKLNFRFTASGATTVMLRAGQISDNAPMTEFFNGYGTFVSSFSLLAPYSFATMRQNEFLSKEYAAIHIRHDLGTWLFPANQKFNPAFVLAQNIGFGRLDTYHSAQFGLDDYRKGYYESGFEANNLFHMDFISWGVGIYYRYGPYRLPVAGDNFAYKFSFYFKL